MGVHELHLFFENVTFLIYLVSIDVEGRSRNMVVSPLDKYNVGASLLNHIVDRVLLVPSVLNHHLFARGLGAVDSHVQDVVAGAAAVHGEAVVSADPSRLSPGTFHPYRAGIALVENWDRPKS